MGYCGRNWWKWAVLGAVGGLYWLGRRQRANTRFPSISAIEEPAAVDAYNRLSELPQLRFLRSRLTAYIVRGRQNIRVLDVGSGNGMLDVALARRPEVREVTGIDLSDAQVHLARAHAEKMGVNANFLVEDAAELPFPDASFEVVVSTLSLHHWERPLEALRELHRVLVPGGSLIVFDLRRDVPALFLGLMTLLNRYVVPEPLRETGEPLQSFQAAYAPWEAVLLAAKAGWADPRVSTGPLWLVLEAEKAA